MSCQKFSCSNISMLFITSHSWVLICCSLDYTIPYAQDDSTCHKRLLVLPALTRIAHHTRVLRNEYTSFTPDNASSHTPQHSVSYLECCSVSRLSPMHSLGMVGLTWKQISEHTWTALHTYWFAGSHSTGDIDIYIQVPGT